MCERERDRDRERERDAPFATPESVCSREVRKPSARVMLEPPTVAVRVYLLRSIVVKTAETSLFRVS